MAVVTQGAMMTKQPSQGAINDAHCWLWVHRYSVVVVMVNFLLGPTSITGLWHLHFRCVYLLIEFFQAGVQLRFLFFQTCDFFLVCLFRDIDSLLLGRTGLTKLHSSVDSLSFDCLLSMDHHCLCDFFMCSLDIFSRSLSDRRYQLVLLLLRSVHNVDSRGVLMTRARFACATTATSSQKTTDETSLGELLLRLRSKFNYRYRTCLVPGHHKSDEGKPHNY